MNLKSFRSSAFAFAQTAFLSAVTIFSVIPFSCKVSTEGIQIIGGDYSPPVVEDLSVLSDSALQITFSEKVSVKSALLSAEDKIPLTVQTCDDDKTVTFNFNSPTQIGKSYEFYAVVEDSIGNSLTFSTEFTGYNSCLPKLIMTEAQIKYTKANLASGPEYRSEFIEFLVLSDGNLAGLRLMSACDGEDKAYDFPAIEVQKGQVFLVHMRTAGEGCICEDGDNLNLASARFSSDKRDLWSENTSYCFNDSSDVIYVLNKTSGAILDGFMYAKDDAAEWTSDCKAGAENLVKAGIYESLEIENAASVSGVTPLKSFHRIDAAEIYSKIMSDQPVDYPVLSDRASWSVYAVDPGDL